MATIVTWAHRIGPIRNVDLFDFTSFFSSFKIYVVWLFTFRFLNFLDVAMDFEIVSTEDCGAVPNDLSGASRTEMYVKLEKDLLEQIKMCQANRIYFKSTGDVPSTNKFHQVKFSWNYNNFFFFQNTRKKCWKSHEKK